MRLARALILAIILPSASCSAADGTIVRGDDGWVVTAGALAVSLSDAPSEIAGITVAGQPVGAGAGGVTLIDGRAKRVLPPLRCGEARFDGGMLVADWSLLEEGLRGSVAITPTPAGLRWLLTVENTSPEQAWLEARLGLPIDPAEGWSYWDGRNEPVAIAAGSRIVGARAEPVMGVEGCTQLPTHYGLNTPVSAAWCDRAGLAVALDVAEIRSYFAGGAEPGLSSRDALYYATQLVIDAGETARVTFHVFSFDHVWGLRGALEGMYALHPEAYAPDPAADPRVMSHCMITGAHTLLLGQPFVWEEARRLRMSWTWATMARYAGFCYPPTGRQPTEEQAQQMYWPFTNPRYDQSNWVSAAIAERGWLTPEEHVRYVQEAFEGVRDALAIGGDITAQYADKALIDTEFPESRLMTRPDIYVDIPNQALVYSWATPWGRRHAELVDELMETIRPAGVNLDNAVGYDRHYALGVDGSPGRAFNHEAGRVYCINGTADALQIANAREHTPDGRRPFVGANTIGTYFGAAICSASLIESLSPFRESDDAPRWRGKFTQPGYEHYMALRYLLGAKMMIFCGPYPWSVELTEEQKALPQPERDRAFVAEYERMMVDYPLFAYRVGAGSISYVLTPCSNVRAHADTVQRLARAGWRAVPGARAYDDRLWVERFGEVPGGFITVGNPTDEPVNSTVACDPARIGCVAMVGADGSPIDATVADGASAFTVALAPRTPMAAQMVARFEPALPDDSRVSATAGPSGTRIEVDCPAACATTLAFALPDGHTLTSVTLGGATVPADGASCALALPARRSVIEVAHQSRFEVSAEVAGFALLEGDGVGCAIVLPDGAPDELRRAADHLSRYLQYWRAHTDNPTLRYDLLWAKADPALQIPIFEAADAPEGVRLIVLGAPEAPVVRGVTAPQLPEHLDGRAALLAGGAVLAVQATGPAAMDATVRALLERLDERHTY